VVDTGAAVAEAEDSMVGSLEDSAVGILAGIILLPYLEDTMAAIGAGIMVAIVEDTMEVIEVDTTEGSMAEVFTRIGDYGDGDIGGGLFWDGPI